MWPKIIDKCDMVRGLNIASAQGGYIVQYYFGDFMQELISMASLAPINVPVL